uniref:SDR family NAD(P)-dependent oxidoreductase n=1 Tax=Aegilops tauschii subsp. strangulata TaxID=200361 RepID=A0A453L4S8_AEGTS
MQAPETHRVRDMAVPVWFFSLASLGALHAFAISFRLIAYLSVFPRRPIDLRRRYGAWAIVTGPTSGIGRSMALELAERGLNLVLVGRDPAKLGDVSETISRGPGRTPPCRPRPCCSISPLSPPRKATRRCGGSGKPWRGWT